MTERAQPDEPSDSADSADGSTDTDAPEAEVEDVFAGDDPKAKFREALARKAGNKGGAGSEAGGGGKVGSAHGPAKAQRTFRRKSGG